MQNPSNEIASGRRQRTRLCLYSLSFPNSLEAPSFPCVGSYVDSVTQLRQITDDSENKVIDDSIDSFQSFLSHTLILFRQGYPQKCPCENS